MDPWLEHFARANFRRSADTAHDLKTPLNVAVLNLELLRMRLRKLGSDEDAKIESFTRAIELELRRMGSIFDAFFLLSTPPGPDTPPTPVEIARISAEIAALTGFSLTNGEKGVVHAHESRIREAVRLFFEGAASLLAGDERRAAASLNEKAFTLEITGSPVTPDLELTKVFKFYYTDPQGNPDLSLAVARLIAETYGGELTAAHESGDKVSLRLSFPLGAR
jgi:hypothetical protein